jgi:DNA-binding NtrC family response regulator
VAENVAVKLPARRVLTKPFKLEQLTEIVREALAELVPALNAASAYSK